MILLPAVLALSLAQPAAAAKPAPRAVVVISDLHMGLGRTADGVLWDRYEDFRWAPELRTFLDQLDAEVPGPVDLVLAGDTFDLWQGRDGLCGERKVNRNLGCTEREAILRIDTAIAQHGVELQALEDFASRGDHRLFLIPGNHDAALLFPGVAARLKAAVPAAQLRDTLWSSEYEPVVVVDHGHLIGKNANSFDGWPKPFLDCPEPGKGGEPVKCLQRPWGEQFVVQFFSAWENEFPTIDNTTEDFAGAKLAMEAVGTPKKISGVRDLIRFFFFDVSLRQLAGVLGKEPESGPPPTWDIAKMRKGGDEALADALPAGDPLASVLREGGLAESLKAEEFQSAIATLTDDDLRAICDREFVNRVGRIQAGEKTPVIEPCPVAAQGKLGADVATLGGLALGVSLLEEAALADRLKKIRGEIGKEFVTYVWGHTHAAKESWEAIHKGKWRPVAINSGAWQRVVTPAQVKAFRTEPGGALKSPLVYLEAPLSALPPCYTYVLVPASGKGIPRLRSWRLKDGHWGHGAGRECAEMPLQLERTAAVR